MKLKIINISIENCLKLTHHYLTMNSLFAEADPYVLTDLFKTSDTQTIENMLSIPVIIFIKDRDGDFTTKSSSSIKQFPYLLDTIFLDITLIVNPEILFHFIYILKKSADKNIGERLVNVVFIKDELNDDLALNVINKMNFLNQLLIIINKGTSSLNIDLLEKMYDENELNSFGYKSIKNLFPTRKKASIVKSNSDIKNPWLNLYLQPNKIYLSFTDASYPKKEIKVIHCPVCATELKANDELVSIKDGYIHFDCSHNKTQFARYHPFKIPCKDFAPDTFLENDKKKLLSFFKNNIQPINIDSIYMIQILRSQTKPTYLTLKKFMKFKSVVTNVIRKNIQKKFLCPICGKSHFINFKDSGDDDYVDINSMQYIHFSKMFILGDRLEFNCDHSGTLYEMYKRFSIKATQSKSFMEQAVLMTERFSANFMDGKKVIIQVVEHDTYIIDLANYL